MVSGAIEQEAQREKGMAMMLHELAGRLARRDEQVEQLGKALRDLAAEGERLRVELVTCQGETAELHRQLAEKADGQI